MVIRARWSIGVLVAFLVPAVSEPGWAQPVSGPAPLWVAGVPVERPVYGVNVRSVLDPVSGNV